MTTTNTPPRLSRCRCQRSLGSSTRNNVCYGGGGSVSLNSSSFLFQYHGSHHRHGTSVPCAAASSSSHSHSHSHSHSQTLCASSLLCGVGDGSDADADDCSDIAELIITLADACKAIGNAIETAPLMNIEGYTNQTNASGDSQKKLDVVANEILTRHLRESNLVSYLASEEEENVQTVTPDAPFVVVFDPLDGSRNVDVSIPVGTIFGVYRTLPNAAESIDSQVLRPGRDMLFSGYANYSVQTTFALASPFANQVDFYTLDRSTDEFVQTAERVQCPPTGEIYSLNDARYFDWSDNLRRYIDDMRQGKNESGKSFSSRYVCSLVSDFHRTLLQGGWCGNPRSHLRVVYECAPLALIAERAGGAASDGTADGHILDITPTSLHARTPLFCGSRATIDELRTYGDVRQVSTKTYAY